MIPRAHYFVFALLFIALTGCEKCNPEPEPLPDGSVRLDMDLTWESEPYAVQQVATDHNGYPIRLDNLQLYVAPVELRNSAGEWTTTDDVFLIDYSVHAQNMTIAVEPGTYEAVRFGLGLPPEINTDIDPASYPNDHPLSVLGSAGMFWTWASGYIFVKYEGKFATEQGTQLLESVSYHCGTDASYRTVTLELPTPLVVASESETQATLTFDAAKALYGSTDAIDLAVDPVTHNANGDSLGGRMMDLLINAWNIEVQ